MKLPDKVAIIGVGLIGGSIGLALKSLPEPPQILGLGRNLDNLKKAQMRGAVDLISDNLESVADCDLVIICVPVRTIQKTAARILPVLKPGTIVTDAGSTKKAIVKAIEAMLPPGVHFIGGHPMAGSEAVGIENATADLLSGAIYLLTPTEKTDSRAYETLHAVITAIGARLLAIDPEEHDRAMAIISHLPHLLSTSLVSLAGRLEGETENLLMLSAGGFRDMTRLAASSPEIWLDIVLTNKSQLLRIIDFFHDELLQWRSLLEQEDEEKLMEAFKAARKIRSRLPGATALLPERLYWFSVELSDQPGAISEVTLAVGKRGINIEDLRMIHRSDEKALLHMAFDGREKAEEACGLLREKGYDIQFSAGEN